MKSTTLTEHKKSSTLTTTLLLKLTRRDGKNFYLTIFNEDIEFQGNVYKWNQSFTLSAIVKSDDLAVNNAEIKGILNISDPSSLFISNSIFLEADFKAGLWEEATFVIYEVNFLNTSEFEVKFRGTTGRYELYRSSFMLELRSVTQKFNEKVNIQYTNLCRANFCDSVCRLKLSDYTFRGAINSVLTKASWTDESLNQSNSTVTAQVTGASKATRAVFTAPAHNLNSGDSVVFTGFSGGLNDWRQLNGREYIITRLSANTFSIAFDSSKFDDVYSGSGLVTTAIVSEYFKYGKVTFTSGNNEGLSFDVIKYRPNFVEIFTAGRTIFQIQIGDTYQITAGCDKFPRTCKDRFNNKVNFDAEDLLPSIDDLAANAG